MHLMNLHFPNSGKAKETGFNWKKYEEILYLTKEYEMQKGYLL